MRFRLSPSRYISTHSASGARRNRLSIIDPILPRPAHKTGGHRGTKLSGVRWRCRGLATVRMLTYRSTTPSVVAGVGLLVSRRAMGPATLRPPSHP